MKKQNPFKKISFPSDELYEFEKYCLFCGEDCVIDERHRDRSVKNPIFECGTADRGKKKMSFKETILQMIVI